MDLKAAMQKIDASDFKMTRARLVILETIFAAKGPFSANDLHAMMNRRSSKRSVDVVTIYRNLTIFEQLKILNRCDFSQDEAKYEIAHGAHGHHHHHIVCRNCEKVVPLEFCILEGQEQVLKKLGYSDLSHRLEYTGVCSDCANTTAHP
jgi:Fur family ferric uptake transcriptional regulator